MSFLSVRNYFSGHFFSASAQILPSALVAERDQMHWPVAFAASPTHEWTEKFLYGHYQLEHLLDD